MVRAVRQTPVRLAVARPVLGRRPQSAVRQVVARARLAGPVRAAQAVALRADPLAAAVVAPAAVQAVAVREEEEEEVVEAAARLHHQAKDLRLASAGRFRFAQERLGPGSIAPESRRLARTARTPGNCRPSWRAFF